MSDFLQPGPIATLHLLQDREPELIEAELEEGAIERRITLVLPCLISEMDGPALQHIVSELREINYLSEIVITLGPATDEEFTRACSYFQPLKKQGRRVRLIWNNGRRISGLFDEMRDTGLDAGPDGKGRSAWMAYGYVVSRRDSHVIALHDCDIVSYDRNLLNRLVYPTLMPDLNYQFSKGYYSRVKDRLYGRTTRLLVTPLLQSLVTILGNIPILHYLKCFRYPLAGEFSMAANLALVNNVPSDWGLEVGVLAEVYRNCSLNRVCQVGLCQNYEHKHQILSPEDPDKGLNKMAIDISRAIFAVLYSSGTVMSVDFFDTLRAVFVKEAQNLVNMYQDDARINGLMYDRHTELEAVKTFAQAVRAAADEVRANPLGARPIPNWSSVFFTIPDMDEKVMEAVELDNSPHFG